MKWLKEIEAWLLPIKLNCGEASYEASAVDLTLKRVKELEDNLAQAKKIIRSLICSDSLEIGWGEDIGEAREFLDKLEEK